MNGGRRQDNRNENTHAGGRTPGTNDFFWGGDEWTERSKQNTKGEGEEAGRASGRNGTKTRGPRPERTNGGTRTYGRRQGAGTDERNKRVGRSETGGRTCGRNKPTGREARRTCVTNQPGEEDGRKEQMGDRGGEEASQLCLRVCVLSCVCGPCVCHSIVS